MYLFGLCLSTYIYIYMNTGACRASISYAPLTFYLASCVVGHCPQRHLVLGNELLQHALARFREDCCYQPSCLGHVSRSNSVRGPVVERRCGKYFAIEAAVQQPPTTRIHVYLTCKFFRNHASRGTMQVFMKATSSLETLAWKAAFLLETAMQKGPCSFNLYCISMFLSTCIYLHLYLYLYLCQTGVSPASE